MVELNKLKERESHYKTVVTSYITESKMPSDNSTNKSTRERQRSKSQALYKDNFKLLENKATN